MIGLRSPSTLAPVKSGRSVDSDRLRAWAPAAGALALLTVGLVLLSRVDYQLSGAVLVAPVLLLISLPLIDRAKKCEPDPWVRRLFIPALAAMFLATLARYWVSFDFYGGRVDAGKFSRAAFDVAEQFRDGVLVPTFDGELIGNGFIILLTGAMFAVIGPSILGAFLIWAWIGYWGLYFCYRAFRVGLPTGDHRRYAVLIFFLPSMLFWTGAVGKEAWMMLSIGLTLLGSARLLSHQRGALPLLITGMLATALVRPHITLLLYGALFIALILRRSLGSDRLGPVVKLGFIAVLIPLGFLILDQAGSFLGVDAFTPESVGDLLERAEQTSDTGNSTFAAVRATDPLSALAAAVSVLFRPFPWEATSLQLLMSAVEGMILAGLATLSLRRASIALFLLRNYAYVALALIFIATFIIAFSSLGNFGLLVRERIMVLPLLFVLLALPCRAKIPAEQSEELPPTTRTFLTSDGPVCRRLSSPQTHPG